MRTVYHQRLTELAGRLGEMCSLAGIAMKRATQALLEADIGAAEQVIRDHERIVAMRAQVEKEAFALLALQHPVAGELREIFSAVQIIADTERMGALAVHIARSPDASIRTRCFLRKFATASPTWRRWQSRWVTVQDKCW